VPFRSLPQNPTTHQRSETQQYCYNLIVKYRRAKDPGAALLAPKTQLGLDIEQVFCYINHKHTSPHSFLFEFKKKQIQEKMP
jgi:hypothetical protein